MAFTAKGEVSLKLTSPTFVLYHFANTSDIVQMPINSYFVDVNKIANHFAHLRKLLRSGCKPLVDNHSTVNY